MVVITVNEDVSWSVSEIDSDNHWHEAEIRKLDETVAAFNPYLLLN